MKNPYTVLNISPNASAKEIKKAYLDLAQVYHPDKPSGDEHKFKAINEAYQELSKNKFNNSDYMSELFRDIDARIRKHQRPHYPPDDAAILTFTVTLDRVKEGVDIVVSIPRSIDCQACRTAIYMSQCDVCDGYGWVNVNERFITRIERKG